jgi:signal transduction histidine kinase
MPKDERAVSQAVDSSNSINRCYYVAHELANPLGGMLMSVDVIEKYLDANPHVDEEMGELTRILKGEIKRLILLLKQFRSSEISSDDKRQRILLEGEIRELLKLQLPEYERRGIRINQDIPLDLPSIPGNRDKLRQILLNLWNNAVEAMPNGGTLTIRSFATERWLYLDVADTGNGVPEGMRIFECVVTSKPDGGGLGLLIVRDLVEQHHGTISYTTKPGMGTTFHLKFPLARPFEDTEPIKAGAFGEIKM